jgi:hypothetical protein
MDFDHLCLQTTPSIIEYPPQARDTHRFGDVRRAAAGLQFPLAVRSLLNLLHPTAISTPKGEKTSDLPPRPCSTTSKQSPVRDITITVA